VSTVRIRKSDGHPGGVRWGAHLLAAAPITWLAVLFLVPLGFTVVFAFGHPTFGGVSTGFTLANFKESLSGLLLTVFLRTLRFAAMGTVLCLAVAVPIAYFAARKAGRYRTVLLVVLLVPYLTSFLLRILSWQILMAPGGQIQDVLNFLHLHHGTLNLLYTQTAVFIGIVYAYLPIAIIPMFVAFERVPNEAIEASKDLGAGRLRTFWHVSLRLARPGLATSTLLVFVPMTGEVVIPQVLGGGRGLLMGGLISSEYLTSQNYAVGSAMAVLVLAILVCAVALLSRLTRGFDEVPA
jgi:spermidine/putrescine transport system permease protein